MSGSSEILEALRDVVDPEIGVNIVDLGLVYEAEMHDADVRVVMTMTSAACPLGEAIADEVRRVIRRGIPRVSAVSVEIVNEPPWQPSMMSEAARRQLGWT